MKRVKKEQLYINCVNLETYVEEEILMTEYSHGLDQMLEAAEARARHLAECTSKGRVVYEGPAKLLGNAIHTIPEVTARKLLWEVICEQEYSLYVEGITCANFVRDLIVDRDWQIYLPCLKNHTQEEDKELKVSHN